MNLSRTITLLSREGNGDSATAAEPPEALPHPAIGHPLPPGPTPHPRPAAPSTPQAALVGVGLTVTMR